MALTTTHAAGDVPCVRCIPFGQWWHVSRVWDTGQYNSQHSGGPPGAHPLRGGLALPHRRRGLGDGLR